MSKFSVLVIGPENFQELSDVLEPYQEHENFLPYIKFTREDKAAERKEKIKQKKKLLKNSHAKPLSESESAELISAIYKLENMSDEDYFQDETRYYDISHQTTNGEPISTYNPNSRWNSWDYDRSLVTKKGDALSCCRKKDIDFRYISQINLRNTNINCEKMNSGKFSDYVKAMMFDYWYGETEEQYRYRKSFFMTHAYILNGKWHDRGKVGWYGSFDEEIKREKWIEKYKNMLKKVKPNTVLTTIICHI